jgi:hypothetical protein
MTSTHRAVMDGRTEEITNLSNESLALRGI